MSQRSLARTIWQNFWNSLRPRKTWGECVGKDYNGTEYYEITQSASSVKQKPRRWFIPPKDSDFQQDIPIEWEAWLRYRRREPPTEEEVMTNLQKIIAVRKNAAQLEHKSTTTQPAPEETGVRAVTDGNFPIYKDLEGTPGGTVLPRKF